MTCFGGAGGQHACAVARSLGISEVLVHKYAGILSAYGMALADVVEEAQEPCAKVYTRGEFTVGLSIVNCKITIYIYPKNWAKVTISLEKTLLP